MISIQDFVGGMRVWRPKTVSSVGEVDSVTGRFVEGRVPVVKGRWSVGK